MGRVKNGEKGDERSTKSDYSNVFNSSKIFDCRISFIVLSVSEKVLKKLPL